MHSLAPPQGKKRKRFDYEAAVLAITPATGVLQVPSMATTSFSRYLLLCIRRGSLSGKVSEFEVDLCSRGIKAKRETSEVLGQAWSVIPSTC